MAGEEILERFRRSRPRGVFLDFDGTLSEIVSRPDKARLVPQAREILAELAGREELVAVVSGRQAEEVRALLDVPGVEVFGQYGIEGPAGDGGRAAHVRSRVEEAARKVPGAWVEDKGATLAVHYRAAPDPADAESRLRPTLQAIAGTQGLIVLRGKMVLEIAPAETPGKGAVIVQVARARGLSGCLFAGDDRADIEGFAALDALAGDGFVSVKVAVRTEETPGELIDQADIVVERPGGLLTLLARL